MGLTIQIELSDANDLGALTGVELIPAEACGKPVKISINQLMEFIKQSPISSFIMVTNGPLASKVAVTMSDDQTFQYTKIS